jgi:hypothetical protein
LLQEYISERDVLLENLLFFEARGSEETCSKCNQHPGLIRCSDCLCSPVFCTHCALQTHSHLPFHKLDKWNGKFFEKTSLHALGYVIRLGHGGISCPNTHSTPGFHTTLVILNTNGIFTHRILWCECEDAPSSFYQLFKAGFFPSSFKKPQTAFTFHLLDYFYIDSMECKTAALSFCQKLARLSDNAFPGEVKVS